MKLVTFEVATTIGPIRRIGALTRDGAAIIDLNTAYRRLAHERKAARADDLADFLTPPDMLTFLRGEQRSMDAAREAIEALTPEVTAHDDAQIVFARTAVRLLAPVPKPPSIREFSEWAEHGKSMGFGPRPKFMCYSPSHAYNGNPGNCDGPDDPLIFPTYTELYDLEPELGLYIGKAGANLTREQARDHIAGYTLFIDPSARDVQMREGMGMFKSKDFQFVMGPCLVTTDEFNERQARCWFRINGEQRWEYDLGYMRRFWAEDVVAFASDSEPLEPGDFIGVGTIGTGAMRDAGVSYKPGDVFEFGIEGLGVLTHRIAHTQGSDVVKAGLAGAAQTVQA